MLVLVELPDDGGVVVVVVVVLVGLVVFVCWLPPTTVEEAPFVAD